MSMKAIIGVIIVAVFIGILYVVFEKSFMGGGALSNSKSSSAQELSKGGKSTASPKPEETIIKLPEMHSQGAAIDASTNMLNEAEGLSMRDYSGVFEDFKESVSNY